MAIHSLAEQMAAGSNPAIPVNRQASHNKRGPRPKRLPRIFLLFFNLGLVWAALLTAPQALAERRPLPGIIGRDDRVPLDSKSWPWQALGRINQANGGHCTGALIAADTVLTAAHCLMDRFTGLWLDARELVFVAGYHRDEDAGFARGRGIFHGQGVVDPRHPALKDIPNDWAVLYLDHPLPIRPVRLHALPLTLAGSVRLLRAGYSQDRPHLLSTAWMKTAYW